MKPTRPRRAATLGVDALQVSVMLGDGTNVIPTGIVPGMSSSGSR